MKVLFVTQSLGKGGAERLVLEISKAIRLYRPEVKVKIVSLSERNDYPDLTQMADIVLCKSSVKLSLTGKSIINIEEYEKIVDEFQPDVIHSHTYKAELVSREKPRKNIRYFTHVHSDFPEFEPFTPQTLLRKKRLTKYYERARMFDRYRQCNNHFITISRAIHENLLRQLPVGFHKNVTLMPNAIDFEKFSSRPLPETGNSPLKLISVGRFQPHKNQAFLMKVAAELKKRGSLFTLQLAGIGSELENVQKLALQLGVDDCVQFSGLINDIENHYAASHIYVHPSKYEPFGLVLVEAMAAGLPVVCLDAGGNRDLIEQGRNGYLLSGDATPEAFADKILHLYHQAEHYCSVSSYARQFASVFGIQQYVANLLDLYKKTRV
jgi:glycosyltransferase involved in cell wall biosynthesis